MKVLLPWYNHPLPFDQLHGPIRSVLLLKIKTYFEITYAFQKIALVAEVLVCDISNHVMFRYHPLRYCKMQRLTLLFSAHKSRPLNLSDRRQRSFLTKIGALYWGQGYTIIMFNLIIPNLDVKMRPRPTANPNQQEKKTRKYNIYVMFQFAGNIIKNDAKITDLFPQRVFLLRGEGGCSQVTAKKS